MALSGLAACGPTVDEPVEELRVTTCGADGPARLLPDVIVFSATLHDERILAASVPSLDPENEVFTVWSVGPCGEDPFVLYEGHGSIQAAGDLLLVCEDDGSARRGRALCRP